MNLTLVRFCYHPRVTLGHLFVDGLKLATLEEPWSADPDGPGGQKREPGHYESCVPDGLYNLIPHSGAQFQGVYCLVNQMLGVYRWPGDIPAGQKWGRATILIHNGNVLDHTLGCILIGRAHDGYERVKDSRLALADLQAKLGTERHSLEIRPIMGTREDA
jgi:hypothetical protein